MKIGFLHVLTIVFVIAKIWGYITWSWWLVFLPIIILMVLNTIASFAEKRKEI